jgi:adenylosuccinate lyase
LSRDTDYENRENIIMRIVSKGGDRQDAHEHIRVLSHQASDVVKKEGKDNDLIARIENEPFFANIKDELKTLVDPKTFVGRAPEQVSKFVSLEVAKALVPYQKALQENKTIELNV